MRLHALPRRSARAVIRRWLACWLLIALPVYGLSGTLTELLGASHHHRALATASADPMAGWRDFRRDGGGSLGSGFHVHSAAGHTHSVFQRHHHDANDETVMSIDGASGHHGLSGDGPATTGSATLTLALPAAFDLKPPTARTVRWQSLATPLVATREPDRLERPPRA